MWTMMNQLKERIVRVLENGQIKDIEEKQKLEYLLRTKKSYYDISLSPTSLKKAYNSS